MKHAFFVFAVVSLIFFQSCDKVKSIVEAELRSLVSHSSNFERNYFFRDLNIYMRVQRYNDVDTSATIYFSRTPTFGSDYVKYIDYPNSSGEISIVYLPPNKLEFISSGCVKAYKMNQFEMVAYNDSIFPMHEEDATHFEYPFYHFSVYDEFIDLDKFNSFDNRQHLNKYEDSLTIDCVSQLPTKESSDGLTYCFNLPDNKGLLYVKISKSRKYGRVSFSQNGKLFDDCVVFNFVEGFRNIDVYLLNNKLYVLTLGQIIDIKSSEFEIENLSYTYSDSLFCPKVSDYYILPRYSDSTFVKEACIRLVFNRQLNGFMAWDIQADSLVVRARKDNMFGWYEEF